MKMITIMKNNWMMSITGKRWKITCCLLEKSYFTSADISMLGYGCGVCHYPQFFVKYLGMYQVLPRPYLGYFGGFTGDKLIKKRVLDLSSQAETFFW